MSVSAVDILKKRNTYIRKKHKTNTIAKNNTAFPRLLVSRSLKHIYGHIVDFSGKTLVQINDKTLIGTKSEKAFLLGKKIALAALSSKITNVVFDRNGYLYHGRVKNFAEGARESGLVF